MTNEGNDLGCLLNQGLVNGPANVEDIVINHWIERINSFDPKQLEEQARAWKE